MATSTHAAQAERKNDAESQQDVEKLKTCFIGSIDQGTTSTRFLIFNGLGVPVASHQIEFKQMYPHSGYVASGLDSIDGISKIDSHADGWNKTLARS